MKDTSLYLIIHLIDYYYANKYPEHTEKISESSDSFVQKINKIDEEDNPVVIIAE